MIPIGRGEGGDPTNSRVNRRNVDETGGWATSTSGTGGGFSLNVDRINLGVRRFSRFLRSAALKPARKTGRLSQRRTAAPPKIKVKIEFFSTLYSGCGKSIRRRGKRTSGAEARTHFPRLNDTSKLMPFPFVEKF